MLVVVLAGAALATTVLDRSSSPGSDGARTGTDGAAVEPLPGVPGGELVDVATFPRGLGDHIDPALVTTLGGAQVANALYDTLTEVDVADPDDPQVLPQVAASWDVADGGATWTFTIREGLRFSDGEAVLPSSFVRGWERATDPGLATSAASAFAYIDGGREKLTGASPTIRGVRADDDALTLTVELDHPNRGFDAVVGLHLFAPMPSAVDRLDDQAAWEDTVMVGNGPFVLESPRSSEEVVLARNPEWDGTRYDPGLRLPDQPYLERIRFRASPDPDTAFAAFTAGEAHVAGVTPEQQREARDRFSNTFDVPIFSTFHLQVGWRDPVVGGPDNLLLRRAILQAINRAEVNDEEFLGTALAADGITSPGIPGYADGACDRCTHDPDAARADLADWTAEGNELVEPVRIQTSVPPGASDPAAAVIVADLAEVGIPAVEEPLGPDFLPRLAAGACQLCLVATFPPYLSYDAVLSDGFHSEADPSRNLGGFADGTFDRLIDDARATSSPTERAAAFHAAEQRLLGEEVGAIPLVWFAHPYVYADDVAEFPVTNLGRVVWEAVSFAEE